VLGVEVREGQQQRPIPGQLVRGLADQRAVAWTEAGVDDQGRAVSDDHADVGDQRDAAVGDDEDAVGDLFGLSADDRRGGRGS